MTQQSELHTEPRLKCLFPQKRCWMEAAFGLCSDIIELFTVSSEMVTCLRGHTGLVKGLTWDPVGKYIASQADDHSLKVWRTVDWQMEANITKPFNEVRRSGCSCCSLKLPNIHSAELMLTTRIKLPGLHDYKSKSF